MKAIPFTSSLLIGALCVSITPAGAASHCQGLAESACATDQSCRWVAGYLRKDGREVSSHCRLGKKKQPELSTKIDGRKLSEVD